jgi:hypothetical protein
VTFPWLEQSSMLSMVKSHFMGGTRSDWLEVLNGD